MNGKRGKRDRDPFRQPATPDSYYGKPVVKAPVWSPMDIGGYLFLGGLAGASSVLAAGADLTGRPGLARAGKIAALGAISASAAALVHDLGRPERFVNMLRVIKPTSPMSVGSWLLAGYGPAAGVAAATSVTGLFPGIGRAATIGAGLLGPAVASYTAVLISDTATPAWHGGYREMPFVFVGSAASAAAGLGLLSASTAEAGPARRAAVFGAALETVAMHRMRSRLGVVAETHREGTAGKLLKSAEVLTVGGALVGALLGRRSRLAAAVGGAALLAGSACTRLGVFHAGIQSAKDPKYTVQPQRQATT